MRLAAIILAAGRSSRMGQPKLLLPWGKTTVVGHLILQWRQIGAAQVAIVHAGDDELMKELDRLGFPSNQRILNPNPDRGMFSSIRSAADWTGWTPETTHWAVVLGDQPHLREASLRALAEFAQTQPAKVCQPVWNARPKHPVILPGDYFLTLRTASAHDLKEFLRGADPVLVTLDDPGLELDLDFPEDYQRAKQLYFGAHS